MEEMKKENSPLKTRRPAKKIKQARLVFHNGNLNMSYKVDHPQNKLTDSIKVTISTEQGEVICNREHQIMEEESSSCMPSQLHSVSAKLFNESAYKKVEENCNIKIVTNKAVKSSNGCVGKKLRRSKFRKIDQNQLLLDAGQKSLGVTQCAECNFVYHAGDPDEEKAHARNHNYSLKFFNFKGWKLERVVERFPTSRIIQVLPNDPKPWIKRICKLLDIIKREIGYCIPDQNIVFKQIYLLIMNNQIVGCLVAESITEGRKILKQACNTDLCSEEIYPVKCGISKIWVAQEFRRQGFGTLLMDSLKMHFIDGCPLSNNEIALGSLTESGKIFADKYFQNLPFYIYGI